MATFDSQELPIQLRILDGELSVAVLIENQPPGVVRLEGRMKPHRQVRFKGGQRVKTRFYPGNPNATQQAMGPTIAPFTLSGRWSDRYLGNGVARQLMDIVIDLCDRAASVEITFGPGLGGDTAAPVVTGTPIVFVGLITDHEFQVPRVQDIGWQLEFSPRSRGRPAAPVVAATSILAPREGFTATGAALAEAAATWTAYKDGPLVKPFGLPQAVRDAMDLAFDKVDVAQDGLDRASVSIAEVTNVPLHDARLLVGACTDAIGALGAGAAQVRSLGLLAFEVRDSARDLVRMLSGQLEALLSFARAAETAADTANGVLETAAPDVLAEVRAPAGTDLRDLAFRFYGDPRLWEAIARANGIEGSAVPQPPGGPSDDPGRPIVIPRQQPGTTASEIC